MHSKEFFTCYGIPKELVTKKGAQFNSNPISTLMKQFNIRYQKSNPYHPQANGLAEVTNCEIENILTKIVHLHCRDWTSRLQEVVWAYRTTWKTTAGFTPFELLYGKVAMLPIEFEHKTLKRTLDFDIEIPKAKREHLLQLNSQGHG